MHMAALDRGFHLSPPLYSIPFHLLFLFGLEDNGFLLNYPLYNFIWLINSVYLDIRFLHDVLKSIQGHARVYIMKVIISKK